MQVQKDETRCPEGKVSPAGMPHRYKCSIMFPRNNSKFCNCKTRIKVMILVKRLIGLEITVTSRISECNLTFAKGKLHIA